MIYLLIFIYLLLGLTFIKVANTCSNTKHGSVILPVTSLFTLNYFIFSLPGILFLYLLKSRVDDFSHYGKISEATVNLVTYSYLWSMLLIIALTYYFLKYVSFLRCRYLDIQRRSITPSLSAVWVIVLIQFALVLFGMFYIGIANIPIFYLLDGDFGQAMILKARMLNGTIPSGIPYIGLILKIYILFVPLYLFNISLTNIKFGKSFFYKVPLYLSIIIVMFYQIYQAHKAPFFIYIITLLAINSYYKGLNKKAILVIIVSLIVLFVFFISSYGIDNLENALILFSNRAFLSQNFGMYLIVEWVKPNLDYLLAGIPFVNNFAELPPRADELVMAYLGMKGEGNVNMNTYFLGEAYSALGTLGLVISPLFVFFSLIFISLFYGLGMKVSKNIFFPMLYVHLFFFFPMNQTFNRVVYFTEGIYVFIASILIWLFLDKLVNRIK